MQKAIFTDHKYLQQKGQEIFVHNNNFEFSVLTLISQILTIHL